MPPQNGQVTAFRRLRPDPGVPPRERDRDVVAEVVHECSRERVTGITCLHRTAKSLRFAGCVRTLGSPPRERDRDVVAEVVHECSRERVTGHYVPPQNGQVTAFRRLRPDPGVPPRERDRDVVAEVVHECSRERVTGIVLCTYRYNYTN